MLTAFDYHMLFVYYYAKLLSRVEIKEARSCPKHYVSMSPFYYVHKEDVS